jgi:hypothetical protein
MSKHPHITMGNNAFWCHNCGAEYVLQMPLSINMFTASASAFTKDHKHCKPGEQGAARMRYSTPEEWVRSWDTGLSSKTIFDYMRTGLASNPNVPLDASDFGRCSRLLAVAPGWRQRLSGLGDAYPAWKPLVENWDMLEQLFQAKDYEQLNASLRSLTDHEGARR